MFMDFDARTSLLEWTENDVHAYFTRLGYPQYENHIKEHHISGDVLCVLDADSLREIGVATIGQRLAILKAIYNLKIAQNIPIEPDHYIPPSEVEERQEHLTVDRLFDLVREQNERLRALEEENRRLSGNLDLCIEDINGLRTQSRTSGVAETESPVKRRPSFQWASFVKPARSPTKAVVESVESPQPSPQRFEHEVSGQNSRTASAATTSTVASEKPRSSTNTSSPGTNPSSGSSSQSLVAPPRPVRQESQDNLKSFKVSLDDPAWKVLPAALKKYKINNDDWQNYAMFICYGSPGSRIERCLSYDEKPLLLFQKLKDAKKNPVFMLKHIKDIRSPIAVAQQKQAARKAHSDSSSIKSPSPSGASTEQARSPDERPNPQSNNHLTAAAAMMMGGATPPSGWPEIMSPGSDGKEREEPVMSADSLKTRASGVSAASTSTAVESDISSSATTLREIPPSTGVSYAVAIYPYMAEQEDEFDVVVGDTFIILSRARGWWVVQRDPAGSGTVEPDTTKQGWVPAGCLLETNVPVAAAIAEATSRLGGAPVPTPDGKTPILPLSILSTSFPGIALMDYKKKGEEELDLAKDDSLRVFKRYNHWSYAVKEESGDRGWVPSWFIGKVPTTTGVPATPSTSGAPQNFSTSNTSIHLDSGFGEAVGTQQSPMSSAFPPMQAQTRTTAVI